MKTKSSLNQQIWAVLWMLPVYIAFLLCMRTILSEEMQSQQALQPPVDWRAHYCVVDETKLLLHPFPAAEVVASLPAGAEISLRLSSLAGMLDVETPQGHGYIVLQGAGHLSVGECEKQE
jgi:hypothetical protein